MAVASSITTDYTEVKIHRKVKQPTHLDVWKENYAGMNLLPGIRKVVQYVHFFSCTVHNSCYRVNHHLGIAETLILSPETG